MHPGPARRLVACVLGIVLVAAACSAGAADSSGSGRPSIVVTTNILGDVVEQVVGPLADVSVLMPPGAEPHEFQVSARQAVAMRDADLLVVNGLGFEGGLTRAVDAARDAGVKVFDGSSAISALDTRSGGPDPHYFTDPRRMVAVVSWLVTHLADRFPAQADAYRRRGAAYIAKLRAADGRMARTLARVPVGRRKLVTNHDVFAYFAARYGYRVVGAVIPSISPEAEPSAKGLDALATTIEREGVPAIFADTSAPTALADKLASGAGVNVRVVRLYSESLGPEGSAGATYIGMMTTDADRIAAALTA